MRKFIVILCCYFSLLSLSAQRVSFVELDYGAIKKAISDPNSSAYYPKLMNRYLDFDTTLTLDEFRLLYYGYIYQKDYDPYNKHMENSALSLYMEKDKLAPADCENIIAFVNISMTEKPFHFHNLRMAIYAYHMKGEKKEAEKRMTMLNGIINAILSSGDGKSLRTAYHVIFTVHEYEIVNYLGYSANHQELKSVWDVIYLSKNKNKIPALYFNVEEMLAAYYERNKQISSGRQKE